MATHRFTLIVEGPDLQAEPLIDELYEAGCDDALASRSHGAQCLDFDREAPSIDEAILSAIADLARLDGVEVVRIADAGLVSMANIAARTGRTSESVRLLVEGRPWPRGVSAARHRSARPPPAVALVGGRSVVRDGRPRPPARRPGAGRHGHQRRPRVPPPQSLPAVGAESCVAGAGEVVGGRGDARCLPRRTGAPTLQSSRASSAATLTTSDVPKNIEPALGQ